MTVESLNHISIRTADVERCRDFYVRVLGFVEGARPPFPFPGYWLYCGGTPAVHIVGEADGGSDLEAYLGKRAEATAGAGALDHIAFQALDIDAMRRQLAQHGVPYRERQVPLLGLRQLFITDPDGIEVELNFPAAATA